MFTFDDFMTELPSNLVEDFNVKFCSGEITEDEFISNITEAGGIPDGSKFEIANYKVSPEFLKFIKDYVKVEDVIKCQTHISMDDIAEIMGDNNIPWSKVPELRNLNSYELVTYRDVLVWSKVSKLNLMEYETLEYLIDYISFDEVAVNQVLPIPFMKKYKDKFDPDKLIVHQPLMTLTTLSYIYGDAIPTVLSRNVITKLNLNKLQLEKLRLDKPEYNSSKLSKDGLTFRYAEEYQWAF